MPAVVNIEVFKSYRRLDFCLTLFYGFASGTRSVIAAYAITFAGTYFLANRSLKRGRLLLFGGATLASFSSAMNYMLEFRNQGLDNFSFSDKREYETVFVDLNIVNISTLTQLFPSQYDFLGFEIPFNALIRPIPRVLWPGKPEGLSTTIEEALRSERHDALLHLCWRNVHGWRNFCSARI